MKENIWLVIAVLSLLGAAAVFPLYNYHEKQQQIEAVDGMIYSYIVGKVEGNDDLLADILTPKAQGILKPGRHAFPGAAEDMGERYSIVRYDEEYEEGNLYYRVEFHRPYTGKNDFYNVIVLNDASGWRIAKNSSVDNYIMQRLIMEKEGVVVHEWEGVKE